MIKKSFLLGFCSTMVLVIPVLASGLPKQSVQALIKALQDSNVEVRTGAAQALSDVPDAAEQAVKPLETALIASADAAEQDALVKALCVANDSATPKRLSDSLANPQFTWGAGAKAKAVYVIGQIGQKKMIKWLTDIVAGEQEPAVRAAAARAIGQIGAPPKKERKMINERADEQMSGRTSTVDQIFLFVRFAALPLAVFLNACVPADELPPGTVPTAPVTASNGTTNTAATYPDLESGGMSSVSSHFTIKGYTQSDMDAIKSMAESLYTKIGNDTGLYTFMASGNFTLVAYRDKDEFLKKTHQPSWCHAVTAGGGIYFYYPDPDLEPNMAHQMVHMIFNSYMADKASSLRWLQEGLAMNEEYSKMSSTDQASYVSSKSSQLRASRMPFSQMTFFVTDSEEKRRTDAWYQQVESVVTYLMTQGSPLAFAQFLSELRTGRDIDQAISDSYSGKFKSFSDLENFWKNTI